MRGIAGALLLLALAGCGESPTLVVADYRPLEPQPGWEAIFDDVLACVRRVTEANRSPNEAVVYTAKYEDIQWHEASVLYFRDPERINGASGVWVYPNDIIFSDHTDGPTGFPTQLVAHEILHYILHKAGHDPLFFDECVVA